MPTSARYRMQPRYDRQAPDRAQPASSPEAQRAEVWGLWHGLRESHDGIYDRNATLRYDNWSVCFVANESEIEAWEAAGGAAAEATSYAGRFERQIAAGIIDWADVDHNGMPAYRTALRSLEVALLEQTGIRRATATTFTAVARDQAALLARVKALETEVANLRRELTQYQAARRTR